MLPSTSWVLLKFNLFTGVINGRICTKNSGSRGKFLFTIEKIEVRGGGRGGLVRGGDEGGVRGGGEDFRMRGMIDFASTDDSSSPSPKMGGQNRHQRLSRSSMQAAEGGVDMNSEPESFLVAVSVKGFKLLR